MKSRWIATMAVMTSASVLLMVAGCDTSANPNDTLPKGTGVSSNGPNPAVAPAGPNTAGPGGATAGIKAIMRKIGQPRGSLTIQIGNELKTEPPPWDQIASQTKEYVQLVADMKKYEPPKGSKESWSNQTTSFEKLASQLDQAATSRDLDTAVSTHGQINKACTECHREHRRMGPGGGFGGQGGGPPGRFPGGYPGGAPQSPSLGDSPGEPGR